ncbi:Mediator of RNA polymerase II transcription subunit 13-like protein [Drosera capensis]
MQSLFVQVLQQGCQILRTCSPYDAVIRPRDFVITRLGYLYEFEYQGALILAGPQGSSMNAPYVPDGQIASSGTPTPQQGSTIPLSMGFVVSKAVPSLKKDSGHAMKEEWPSVLSVSLIDHYGGYSDASNEKLVKASKHGGRGAVLEAKDYEPDSHMILQSLAADLHALCF